MGVRLALACVLAAAGLGCDDRARPPPAPADLPRADRTAADPAAGVTTELDGATPLFGDAVLVELLGDDAAARAGLERVLALPDAPAALAARAALRRAQMEARAGRSRHALDLVVRASALAPADVAIAEGVDRLQADVVAAAGAGDIRGPRLGAPLPGVAPAVAEAFAAA